MDSIDFPDDDFETRTYEPCQEGDRKGQPRVPDVEDVTPRGIRPLPKCRSIAAKRGWLENRQGQATEARRRWRTSVTRKTETRCGWTQ